MDEGGEEEKEVEQEERWRKKRKSAVHRESFIRPSPSSPLLFLLLLPLLSASLFQPFQEKEKDGRTKGGKVSFLHLLLSPAP